MKEWYQNLQQQEQRLLLGGAIFLGLMIFYLAVWEPLTTNYDKLKKSTGKYETLVHWMEEKAVEVKRLKSSGGSTVRRGNQSILGVVDKTAKQLKLGGMVKQVRPEGKNKARVRLENAPFDKVLKWLEVLQQQQGINVLSSSIERQAENGLVNIRLVFEDTTQ